MTLFILDTDHVSLAQRKHPVVTRRLAAKRAQLIGTTFRSRTPQEAWRCFEVFMDDCRDGLAEGRLRGIVDKTFPFKNLHEAHEYMLADGQIGKIVLVND